MDSVHDLGGTDGVGEIKLGEDESKVEPYFHQEWEKEVFALLPQLMGQGLYNIDEFRHAIERMDPAHYLDSPYYEHWLYAMEDRLIEHGIISEEELQSRLEEVVAAENPEELVPEREDPDFTQEILDVIETGASTERDPVEPALEAGDTVRVKNIHPEGHTRCPQYVRQAQGTIAEVRGTFVLPDARAHNEGEDPEPLYSVRFENRELWGEDTAEDGETLHIDLWESYLEEV